MFVFQIGSRETGSCFHYLEYNEFSREIYMIVKFSTEGCYHASISLNGIQLHNGDFDIIVLSSEYKNNALIFFVTNKILLNAVK